MGVLLACHVLAALLAPVAVRAWGRRAFVALALPSFATAVWAVIATPAAMSARPEVWDVSWVPSLGLTLAFRLDPLSWVLTLVVGAVGAGVLVYCGAYFDDDEPGLGRFAASLTAFAGAMFGLVTSDDLIVLYLFWELTTILSYLLIGHRPASRESRAAAMQALVVTTFGGLAMLVGIVVVGQEVGTYRLSGLLDADPAVFTSTSSAVAAALVLVGALSKSALVPFHFWLPAAMAAPTPVSAYLHAAAMVKAGIYLVARLAPVFALTPAWRPLVLVLGSATMLVGAYRSLRQHDLKLLLAYGTVSQLGFLVVLVGSGVPDAALAGVAMLVAHALFKSALFLVVGTIDHCAGTRDLRELSGVGRHAPGLAAAATVAAASMAGVPPLFGFVAKEAAFTAYLEADAGWAPWVLSALVVGSALTFAYSARFVLGAFTGTAPASPWHRGGRSLTGVPFVLAVGGLVAAACAGTLDPLFAAAAHQGGAVPEGHLTLWHGLNAALGLSVLTWIAGGALVAARRHVEAFQERMPQLVAADAVYRAIMRALERLSLEVTGAFQRGSLPLSLGLVLGVLVVVPGGAAALAWREHAVDLRLWDSPAQVAVAVVVVVAAVATVRSRHRLRAVFLTGVTGYGVGLLFLLFGAPDLALTQVLVETFSIVVFVLGLRRLPRRFGEDASRRTRTIRAGLGVSVGAVAGVLTLVVPQSRTAAPASQGMAQQALAYGGGENIVNVILVDVRAWDTMGELSVVLAAATGIASLVFLDRGRLAGVEARVRDVRDQRRSAIAASNARQGRSWLTDAAGLVADRHSVLIEVVIRLVFRVVLVWSLYLLFTGHNLPGGGFAGGIVAGLALTMRYLAGGRNELRAALPLSPAVLLGAGLFLSAGNALASMVFGGSVLQTWIFDVPVPVVGKVHVVTSVFFDVGVYLVVVGLVLDVLRSLGGALDRQAEDDAAGLDAVPVSGPADADLAKGTP